MGHARYEDTLYYVHMVPDFYKDKERLEKIKEHAASFSYVVEPQAQGWFRQQTGRI